MQNACGAHSRSEGRELADERKEADAAHLDEARLVVIEPREVAYARHEQH